MREPIQGNDQKQTGVEYHYGGWMYSPFVGWVPGGGQKEYGHGGEKYPVYPWLGFDDGKYPVYPWPGSGHGYDGGKYPVYPSPGAGYGYEWPGVWAASPDEQS